MGEPAAINAGTIITARPSPIITTGKDNNDVISDLRGVIFKNPVYGNPDREDDLLIGWETSDEYLSGRVREKLTVAESSARDNPMYAINVEYLRAVQPKPLEAHEISVRAGAH